METAVGFALVVLCLAVLWMARARGGEVIPLLASERAQSTFVMVWIIGFLISAALALEQVVK